MRGKDLRIVFMGTPDFAVGSLRALIDNGYHVVGVVTAPDRPAGRGQKLHQSEVKVTALEFGLPLLQPEKLKDPLFVTDLQSLKADLQIIVAFRMLPEVVWNMPPMGTINLHASLLPNYRGAAPLNWAIINGDKETGVTTFLLKHEIDTGNILFREKIKIGDDMSVGDLHGSLMLTGAALVLKTVDKLAEGNYETISQEELDIDPKRLHAPKIFKETCKINWNNSCVSINNLIRGLSPYPAAWTNFLKNNSETGVKIFRASIELADHLFSPGQIVTDNKKYLKIACADGYLHLIDLQIAGKKRMEIAELLRGFPNAVAYKAE